MKYLDEYRDGELTRKLLKEIEATVTRHWKIMEVCGGQTHAIIKSGLDQLLPPEIDLVHGPGCPVCVTPLEQIDRALAIASRPEVIFTSWVEKGSGFTGKLHMLDFSGKPIHEIDLPPAYSGDWNGALAAPTLANIDADPDLEVVLTTAHSGVVAYDLPGTSHAVVLWGTGRGNFWRNGYLP